MNSPAHWSCPPSSGSSRVDWTYDPCSPTCPNPRSTAVANGQQRSATAAPDLHHRSSTGRQTELPKLAVRVRFPSPAPPSWGRTSSGPAGSSRGQARPPFHRGRELRADPPAPSRRAGSRRRRGRRTPSVAPTSIAVATCSTAARSTSVMIAYTSGMLATSSDRRIVTLAPVPEAAGRWSPAPLTSWCGSAGTPRRCRSGVRRAARAAAGRGREGPGFLHPR